MADPTPPIPPPKHTTRSVHPPQHQAQRHSDPVAPAIASQPPSTRPMIHQHRHPLHPHSAVPISQSSAPLAAHQDAGSNCPNQSTQTPAPDPDPTRPSLRSAQPTSPSSGEKSPLSRLLHHFITKPTLSRTWENRSYAEEQRSAPPAVGMTEIPSFVPMPYLQSALIRSLGETR